MSAFRNRRRLYLGLAASWSVLAALVWSGPRANSVGFGHGVTAWTYLVNQAQIVVTYLTLVVWPNPLVLDYGPPLPLGLSQVALHAALLTALTLAVGYSWRKTPRVAFLGTVALVTLAPTSSIIPIATEVGAERRMYLPLAALAVLFVVAAAEGLRRVRAVAPHRLRHAGAVLLLLVAASLAVRASHRAADATTTPPNCGVAS